MNDYRKIVHPGDTSIDRQWWPVFCRITITNGKLSIVGVEGPQKSGDAAGGSGQIHPLCRRIDRFASGWTDRQLQRFDYIWERWHLNGMRAGCEHQRAAGWEKFPIDPLRPLHAYDRFCSGQYSWNMLTWVRRGEHPGGLLGEACPTCGYLYGTEWLTEELPADVIADLLALPDSDLTPAWV
jgi:hypothetical protein